MRCGDSKILLDHIFVNIIRNPIVASRFLHLKQIKYQRLVVVHPQSDENMRLQWGF